VFVSARPDGDTRPARASGEGLYAQDTRHLSELRVTVGGLRPVLLSSVMESGHHAVINATNPALVADGDVMVPQETLNVRRTVLIADRLDYRVRVRSFRPHPVATVVAVSLAADFADVFEVRGVGRRTSDATYLPARGRWMAMTRDAIGARTLKRLVELRSGGGSGGGVDGDRRVEPARSSLIE
jgi:glycogen debranching enzyme